MKILTLLLMVVALDCSANLNEGPLAPAPEHTSTTRSIVYELVAKHYVTKSINDVLSSKIFDAYLQNMDPGKSYLLQSDIDDFEIYRYELDDALRKGNLAPAYEMWNRYQDRWIARLKKVIDVLEEGIDDYDFTTDEEFLLDRSDSPWATSDEQLDELWKKRIKLSVLNLRLADKEHDKIQETLLKRYQNQLRMTSQTRREDVYQLYINSFTETYDPHTQYFSPRNTENFNINMSLSLEGIGAVLRQDVEFTKVVNLVTAGPADKSGLLKPNDKIIGVGQGAEGEIVDVIGWRLTDVVQLIRGKKNTIVRLDIIPADAEALNSRIIQITRNTVKLEEQTASSRIIELEQLGETHKLGIIDIPTFYSDFKALKSGDRNYRSTTRDVQRLLKELIAEKVEGVIIDLRNNGGGSLEEARNVTGLFIDRGPIVQIRYKNSRVYTMKDNYPGSIYDGPLAVVVNRLSASASEIFAGAIQDYQRGIIVGTPTFGKGTVQTIVPLPSSHGQLKLTQAKFYRISGDSNQHKGIIPDIIYPQEFDPETIGESATENPLLFDTIKPVKHRVASIFRPLIPDLQKLHLKRVTTDPEFIFAKEAMAYQLERSNGKTISLNEATRIQEKEDFETFLLALKNDKRSTQGLDPLTSLSEEEPAVAVATPTGIPMVVDESREDSQEQEDLKITGNEVAGVGSVTQNPPESRKEESEETDAFLNETGNILLDLISLQLIFVPQQTPDSLTTFSF